MNLDLSLLVLYGMLCNNYASIKTYISHLYLNIFWRSQYCNLDINIHLSDEMKYIFVTQQHAFFKSFARSSLIILVNM